jgi:hypothetical protein
MIDLGTTEFYISVPSMPRGKFEQYSTDLFDEWEKHLEKTLFLPDYSLALEVEEGSVKGAGRIAAGLGALYIGIAQYGSFINGLQTIKYQISTAGDFLAERAGNPFNSRDIKPKVQKRGGTLAALQRLFIKVQRGDLSPEQALSQAKALLKDEAESAPSFMRELEESLKNAPSFHKQLPLPLETQESSPVPTNDNKKVPRPPPSQPIWPPPSQFRVEVWRESKSKKRNIRVVKL